MSPRFEKLDKLIPLEKNGLWRFVEFDHEDVDDPEEESREEEVGDHGGDVDGRVVTKYHLDGEPHSVTKLERNFDDEPDLDSGLVLLRKLDSIRWTFG